MKEVNYGDFEFVSFCFVDDEHWIDNDNNMK